MNSTKAANTNKSAQTIMTYVYDQNAVKTIAALLNSISVRGIDNISALANISRILESPIKEDSYLPDSAD